MFLSLTENVLEFSRKWFRVQQKMVQSSAANILEFSRK